MSNLLWANFGGLDLGCIEASKEVRSAKFRNQMLVGIGIALDVIYQIYMRPFLSDLQKFSKFSSQNLVIKNQLNFNETRHTFAIFGAFLSET